VIIFEPVIETVDAREFTAWPTATRPGLGWLALSGDLVQADVGTVIAAIAVYNGIASEDDAQPSAARLIEDIIEAECLIAQGGLRVRDTETDQAVNPGCCFGLEDWSQWNQVAAGQPLWLGHSPEPWVEHLESTVRLWPSGGNRAVPSAGASPIEIPSGDLPRLVAGAHRQFQQFLGLLESWALPLAAASAPRLAPALATHFRVSWPAPGAAYPPVGDRHS